MAVAFTDDPADLFLALYDELGEEPFRDPYGVRRWRRDVWVSEQTHRVVDEVLGGGRAPRRLIRDITADGARGVFAVMVGLDEALAAADPHSGTAAASDHLSEILERYAENGRLNSRVEDGLLLFRLAFPARPAGQPTLAQYFGLVRVSAAAARELDFQRIGSAFDLPFQRDADESAQTIAVGCVPMLAGYGEMEIQPRQDNGDRRYRLGPKPEALKSRIEAVVRALDRSGAVVGVLPEASLSEELLAEWQRVLPSTDQPRGSKLRWLLVGSGPVGNADPPFNRAVLLERLSGKPILEYDKEFDFTLSPNQLRTWKLEEYLGDERAIEDITRGSGLVIRESCLGRIAILICEDLTHLADLGPRLQEFGVSHIFVPVFSAPIREHGWESGSGANAVTPTGAWIVVANSLAVGRAMGKKGPLGVCCSIGPASPGRDEWALDRTIGRAMRPETVKLLSVSAGEIYRYSDVAG